MFVKHDNSTQIESGKKKKYLPFFKVHISLIIY